MPLVALVSLCDMMRPRREQRMKGFASIAVRLLATAAALVAASLALSGVAQDRSGADQALLSISNDKLTLGIRTQGGAMVGWS
jgi:hypothetical protein